MQIKYNPSSNNYLKEDRNLTIKDIKQQESELIFDSFSNDDAYTLGTIIYEKAKQNNLPVTINITRSGQQLYHVAMPGTTADNDDWIAGKEKVVMRFGHSSELVERYLSDNGSTMEEQYLLSSSEYRAHGGSFPITIKDTGVIGAITVSGLVSDDDHMLVVNSIKEFLGSKDNA